MNDPVLEAAERIGTWRSDPVLFVRECLQAEPDDWQQECLEAIGTLPFKMEQAIRRFCLKASKGPGKSTLMAWVAWWFLVCFPHPKIVATSITEDNLKDGLWTELAKWQQQSDFLRETFTWAAERVSADDHPETWWISKRTWSKSATSDQQSNTLAGIHADYVLFLVDEAGGIPDAVVAAAEAGLANADPKEGRHAILLIAGNPTHLEGPLYRACTKERHLWWVKEISGDPDDPKRAKRVSIEWARAQIDKYGRDHPWVLVNVFGQFPPAQSNALIALSDVEAARRRVATERDIAISPRILGVDVARFGQDRTVFAPRQGRLAYQMREFRSRDTMFVAGEVARYIEKWQPHAVFIDQTGVGGGVVDRLRQLGFNVVGIDGSGKPTSPRYLNKRAEMWDALGDWLKAGGCIPDDGDLVVEMPAPTYWFTSKGQIQLESKDDLQERGYPSPDKADALALTFAMPVAIPDPIEEAARRINPVPAGGRTRHDYDPFEERRV